jgi:hypothetical protein
MVRHRAALVVTTVFFAILTLVGCGGYTPKRHLLSVTVTPVATSAQNFPNGQVQFTAVGTFDRPPSPVTLSQAAWQVSPAPNPPDAVLIDQNGVAQCKAGFTGTVTIIGGQFQCGPTPTTPCYLVHGTAQLTCQ